MLRAPASKVRRITLYLIARNEYENELADEQRKKQEDAEREAKRNAQRR